MYESLHGLIAAERNFRPFLNDDRGRGKTLFVLGTDPSDLHVSDADMKDLEQFVRTGGRLVLAFLPVFTQASMGRSFATNSPGPKKSIADQKEELDRVSLSARWGFDLKIFPLARRDDGTYAAVDADKIASLPASTSISCHTALTFAPVDSAWNTIYARTNDRPVILERKFGQGSIALSADSFLFSNEALLKERLSHLLAWFVGPSGVVIFDETHLGVQEHRGVATLARKYRLHGFLAAVLLLAALFVWRYAFSLLPRSEDQLSRNAVDWIAGKESAAGFTNLLRRNISPRALLATCLQEWNKSCRRRASPGKLERLQTIIDAENSRPARDTNSVAAYREIAQTLARTSPPGPPAAHSKTS